jgi:hypothetical protein
LLQLDNNNSFLIGDLFEEIYLDLPLGFKPEALGLVCKLNKSLYGLRLAYASGSAKFSQSKNDYSLFTLGYGASVILLFLA